MKKKKEKISVGCSKENEAHCVYSQVYSSCPEDKCHIKQGQAELEEEMWG